MSNQRPRLLLRVANLDRSLAFYQEKLSWIMEWRDPASGAAQLRSPQGGAAVLTEDPSLDVQPYMDVAFSEPQPGKRIYMMACELAAMQTELAARGVTDTQLGEDSGYWINLTVPDPDGYLLTFVEELAVPDEGILALYRQGPDLLEEALSGLTEADLDLVRAPGKWSIRQTVLHLIDSDLGAMHRAKFALAEPGRHYAANPYAPDRWNEGLDYAGRSVQTEVALFRLVRQHLLGLISHLPDALDRHVVSERGDATVRSVIKALAGHARGHIDQIRETRRVHGK